MVKSDRNQSTTSRVSSFSYSAARPFRQTSHPNTPDKSHETAEYHGMTQQISRGNGPSRITIPERDIRLRGSCSGRCRNKETSQPPPATPPTTISCDISIDISTKGTSAPPPDPIGVSRSVDDIAALRWCQPLSLPPVMPMRSIGLMKLHDMPICLRAMTVGSGGASWRGARHRWAGGWRCRMFAHHARWPRPAPV